MAGADNGARNGGGPGSERFSGPGLRKAEPGQLALAGWALDRTPGVVSQSPAEEKLKKAFLASGLFARPRCQSDVIVGAGPLVVPAFRRTHWRTEWWKWVVGVVLVAAAIWVAAAVG
jgi:hypothetical protein